MVSPLIAVKPHCDNKNTLNPEGILLSNKNTPYQWYKSAFTVFFKGNHICYIYIPMFKGIYISLYILFRGIFLFL